MEDAAQGLRIKYGLSNQPTDAQVKQWVQLVRRLAAQGRTQEQAGAEAAQQIFPDFRTMGYASEADTIEALLRAAEGK